MKQNLIAQSSITVYAPASKVWSALVDPIAIKQYMFDTTAVSDWHKGSPIIWKGMWQGKPYEDKGVILELEPGRRLQYSHFSPLSGVPDVPENYHTVTIQLSNEGDRTGVSLTQDNNSSEKEAEESEKNWNMMLTSLKKFVEK